MESRKLEEIDRLELLRDFISLCIAPHTWLWPGGELWMNDVSALCDNFHMTVEILVKWRTMTAIP